MNNGFIQFQLWRECPNKCLFCCDNELGAGNKVKMLSFALDRLQCDDIGVMYHRVGFIGGELFSGQITDDIHHQFYHLMQMCCDKVKAGQLSQVCLATSLLYKDMTDLITVIEMFQTNGLTNKLNICTSYDTVYRFHNNASEQLWKRNMLYLQTKYSDLNFHVDILLTEHFIQQVLCDQFNIKKFESEYRAMVDFEEPLYYNNKSKRQILSQLPLLTPTKKSFIRFLHKIAKERQYNLNKMLNPLLKSCLAYGEHNGEIITIVDNQSNDNGVRQYYSELGRKGHKLGCSDYDISLSDITAAYRNP